MKNGRGDSFVFFVIACRFYFLTIYLFLSKEARYLFDSFEKMCCNECYSFEKMCRMLVYSLEKV